MEYFTRNPMESPWKILHGFSPRNSMEYKAPGLPNWPISMHSILATKLHRIVHWSIRNSISASVEELRDAPGHTCDFCRAACDIGLSRQADTGRGWCVCVRLKGWTSRETRSEPRHASPSKRSVQVGVTSMLLWSIRTDSKRRSDTPRLSAIKQYMVLSKPAKQVWYWASPVY